ncbi:hypothetical protein HN51_028012 [Arachis hypogaea]
MQQVQIYGSLNVNIRITPGKIWKLYLKQSLQHHAQKTLVACSSNRHILSVKGRFQHCLMSCTRFIYESFSYNMNNVHCMEIFLCGYWVGPDDDDGWGFVEAVINQIT